MKTSPAPPNPPSHAAFEWLMGVLAIALISGLNLDIWAHAHGRVDQSFFTPWHAVLYGSMALNGIVLGIVAARNVLYHRYPLRRSLPAGYGLSLIGVIVFAIGGGLDLLWHTLFGIEEDIQALLSPTHLLLAVSAALILTGPIRSAAIRLRREQRPSWATHGPLVLSIAATLTLLGFFTQYAHPLYSEYGTKDTRAPIATAIYSTQVDGSHQTRLAADPADDDWGPAVSPDGQRIAYRQAERGSAQSQIVVARADGSQPYKITHSGRHDTQPAWSPDGRSIAYISAPAATSGNFSLLVVPVSGGASSTLVSGVATLNGPAWSPNGRTIVFGSRRGQRDWIASVPPIGGAVSFLAAGADGSWPAWRPDGGAIAFVRDQNSAAAIFSMDAEGLRARRLSAAGTEAFYPAWSPDGGKLAFTSSRGEAQQLYVMNADGSGVSNASRDAGLHADRPNWLSASSIVFAGTENAPYSESQNLSLGVGSFLLQTIVLMGLVLLLVRHWRVPFGALTWIVAFYGFAMVIVSDELWVLPWIVASGVIGDIALAVLSERIAAGGPFYAFGFGFPFIYAACYEAAVASHAGIGWPINLVLGTPVVCGIAGLLLAYAFRPPLAGRLGDAVQ